MRKVLLSLSFVFILMACSSKGPAPPHIDNTQVEFVVLKFKDKESSKKIKTYLCKFTANNTYQSFEEGHSLHAGNYSYSRKGSHQARLVLSYSENNVLRSYEMNLHFETISSGTWESSYNNTQVGAQSGTFEFI